jgi:DNA-binding transcriptional ArsR family regulator
MTEGSSSPDQRVRDAGKPRKVTDRAELRALAHPLRLRLLEELVVSDPATDTATATELAERVGESPANCSWHLRQLAKYGYIEEAPGGRGRERRWRAVIEAHQWATAESDAEFVAAADVAADILLDHEYQALRERRTWRSTDPERWRSAAGSTTGLGWCTADELRQINDQVYEVLRPFFERLADPAARPADSRLVRFVSWAVPARPYGRDAALTADRDGRGFDA